MNQIEYKKSSLLSTIKSIEHGFFTKKGGVSTGVYASLNCSPSSDDDSSHVIENRKRVMQALGQSQAKLFGLHQIHSTTVYTIDSHNSHPESYPKGDALVTKEKGLFLSVLGADCTPILFSDKKGEVVGAAHAGWKGAVTGIVEAVVKAMCDLGAVRQDIQACIGPTIHQPSYEVKHDFIDQLTAESIFPADDYLLKQNDRVYFDLPGYLLQQCRTSHIQAEDLGLDTYQLKDEFFSYRRNTHEKLNDYGRQISVIGIK